MALLATETYPKARRRLRLGIVGGGRGALVGQWHWSGARLSNRWDLVAGALSSDPEVARLSGEDWMLAPERSYSSWADMAKKEAARADGIEAVVICTPNWTHFAIAEAFMKQGIDVICDKPMTTTVQDAEAMVALQRETGVIVALTYPYVYHPMARQAREMVRAGAIGAVRQVMVEYAQDWATEHDDTGSKGLAWRRDPAKVGRASAVGDIGTHAVQLLEFVAGDTVASLRADFHVCGAPKEMEDTAFMGLRMASGAPGAMWVSQAAPGNHCALRLRVYGTKGGLQWDQEYPEHLRFTPLNEPEQIITRGQGAGVLPPAARLAGLPRGHGESLTDAWANLYTEIALAVDARRNGADLPADLLALPDVVTGLRGVRFVHAAADSHEAGGEWVGLE